MEKRKEDEPIELQKDFIETLDAVAREDEEGRLECVTHSSFMAELEERLASTKKVVRSMQERFPEYKA